MPQNKFISFQIRDAQKAMLEMADGAIDAMNKQMKKAVRKSSYLEEAREIAAIALVFSPEVQGLFDSSPEGLASQIGFPAGTAVTYVEAITDEVANSVEMEYFYSKGKAVLTINVQPSNYANLFALAEATIPVSSRRNGSYELEWLDWLLLQGDRIIVQDFYYDPDSAPKGRSGGGTMKAVSPAAGPGQLNIGAWRIPPEYIGIDDDNFITRSLQSKDTVNKYAKLLQKMVKGT